MLLRTPSSFEGGRAVHMESKCASIQNIPLPLGIFHLKDTRQHTTYCLTEFCMGPSVEANLKLGICSRLANGHETENLCIFPHYDNASTDV